MRQTTNTRESEASLLANDWISLPNQRTSTTTSQPLSLKKPHSSSYSYFWDVPCESQTLSSLGQVADCAHEKLCGGLSRQCLEYLSLSKKTEELKEQLFYFHCFVHFADENREHQPQRVPSSINETNFSVDNSEVLYKALLSHGLLSLSVWDAPFAQFRAVERNFTFEEFCDAFPPDMLLRGSEHEHVCDVVGTVMASVTLFEEAKLFFVSLDTHSVGRLSTPELRIRLSKVFVFPGPSVLHVLDGLKPFDFRAFSLLFLCARLAYPNAEELAYTRGQPEEQLFTSLLLPFCPFVSRKMSRCSTFVGEKSPSKLLYALLLLLGPLTLPLVAKLKTRNYSYYGIKSEKLYAHFFARIYFVPAVLCSVSFSLLAFMVALYVYYQPRGVLGGEFVFPSMLYFLVVAVVHIIDFSQKVTPTSFYRIGSLMELLLQDQLHARIGKGFKSDLLLSILLHDCQFHIPMFQVLLRSVEELHPSAPVHVFAPSENDFLVNSSKLTFKKLYTFKSRFPRFLFLLQGLIISFFPLGYRALANIPWPDTPAGRFVVVGSFISTLVLWIILLQVAIAYPTLLAMDTMSILGRLSDLLLESQYGFKPALSLLYRENRDVVHRFLLCLAEALKLACHAEIFAATGVAVVALFVYVLLMLIKIIPLDRGSLFVSASWLLLFSAALLFNLFLMARFNNYFESVMVPHLCVAQVELQQKKQVESEEDCIRLQMELDSIASLIDVYRNWPMLLKVFGATITFRVVGVVASAFVSVTAFAASQLLADSVVP